MPRTRLSICARKRRYASETEANEAARATGLVLRPYRCDRCGHIHLTSRTKGKRIARPVA
jgi:rubrerythrin